MGNLFTVIQHFFLVIATTISLVLPFHKSPPPDTYNKPITQVIKHATPSAKQVTSQKESTDNLNGVSSEQISEPKPSNTNISIPEAISSPNLVRCDLGTGKTAMLDPADCDQLKAETAKLKQESQNIQNNINNDMASFQASPAPTLNVNSYSNGGSGACSDHGGVNCSVGAQANGMVMCRDGWTGSSVLYSLVQECQNQLSDADKTRLCSQLDIRAATNGLTPGIGLEAGLKNGCMSCQTLECVNSYLSQIIK